MSHYDEEFEKAILEASVDIRNEYKKGETTLINTKEALDLYLEDVKRINKVKRDFINGDITEETLLKDVKPVKSHGEIVTDIWSPDYVSISETELGETLDDIRRLKLKDTQGKADGARYCYLSDIANVAFDHPHMSDEIYQRTIQLGEYLSIIVESVDDNSKENAQYYCSEILNNLMSDKVLYDLIGVRAHALSSGKYTVNGYKSPVDVNLLLDAAARHFLQILFVGDIDKESGYAHEAHIAANVVMIHTQLNLHSKGDV